MVATIGGLIVDPNGQTLVVDLTTAGGVRPTAYTAAQGSSTHTLPVTITTRTEFHLTQPLLLTVSVKRNGVEIASQVGTTTTVDVQPGVVQVVTPSINVPGPEGQADLTAALAAERAASNAAYAPLVATYSAAATYKSGQLAVQAGALYQANQDLGPEAFNAAHWIALGGAGGASFATIVAYGG